MIRKFQGISPKIGKSVFIAESADIIGNVEIGENSSIWYNTVLRGDGDLLKVGSNTNIQDGTVVHVDDDIKTTIGDFVTIGHSAIIHSCDIDDNVLIGMGAIILSNVKINKNVIIGAGSLIPPGKEIPSNSLVIGSPGKVVRQLSDKEIENIKESAKHYVSLASKYSLGGEEIEKKKQ